MNDNEVFNDGKIEKRFIYKNIIEGIEKANFYLIIDSGNAPEKYAGGKNESELRFSVGSYASPPRINIKNRMTNTLLVDDIYFQATTRGGREIDKIIDGKVAWKDEATQNAENFRKASKGSWTAAKGVMNTWNDVRPNSGSKEADAIVGGVVLLFTAIAATAAVAGEISDAAAKSVVTQADARYWQNIPGGIYIYMDKLDPGEYSIKVDGLNTQELMITIPDQGITVKHIFDQKISKPPALVSTYDIQDIKKDEEKYLSNYVKEIEKEKSNEKIKNAFSDFFSDSKSKL